MLKRIRLIDFKSFVDEEVELAPFTVLVGINASGKSNLLDALWLLHGLARGLPVDVVLDGEDQGGGNGDLWPGLRGGSAEASRLGTSIFEIQTSWVGTLDEPNNNLESRHRVRVQTRPRPELVEVHLHVLAPEDPIDLVSFETDRMRAYGQIKRQRFGRDGSNFSGALYHLCQDSDEGQTVVDWLAELLAPEIVDLDFIKVEELGDVMAMFIEEGGQRISARSLSDGTLRFLGLLLTLHLAPEGSMLLIEEVDSGLHPARIHVLMELLQSYIRERGLQIIATTHAPSVLQALDEETLKSAILCGRIPEHPGTVLQRLGDLPHFGEVVERRGIAEMLTQGWLEMAL